jgi:hypothetical protein
MNKKRTIIGGIVVVIALAAGYGWYQYNRTVQGLANVSADFSVNATDLIKEFVSSEEATNKKYLNKILSVKGMVKNVETAQNTIVLGDTSDMSGVRCVLDSTAISTIGALQKGTLITVKGAITGFNKDETGLLGSDVQLNRCVLAR